MPVNDVLILERDGPLAILTLNIPSRMNPVTLDLMQSLRESLAQLAADESVHALVLTGAGRGFCSGADLNRVAGNPNVSLGERAYHVMDTLSNRMIQDLHEMPMPVVVAVNGAAAGGGVGVALAGDITLAARSAYFYLPFMPRLGILPDLGSTWFLERLIGRARAMGLALLGDRLSAEQAAEWGLIWRCVDDATLHREALETARRLACLPKDAAREVRAAFAAASRHTLVEQLGYEAGRQRELFDRPELAEGAKAFIEKRDPMFRKASS
jgi:2-(1,2-epoxy-1,2-dihydrophenyl)acetyl-CoA isomerase